MRTNWELMGGGREGKVGDGHGGGHLLGWVLGVYGNQFDNKLHLKNKQKHSMEKK